MAAVGCALGAFAATARRPNALAHVHSQVQTTDGASILQKVQRAVAGDKAASLQRFRLTGTVKRVVVAGTSLGAVRQKGLEMLIALPDAYVRQETDRLDASTITYVYGFHRDTVLNAVHASGPDTQFGGSWGPEQLNVERAELTRIVLGLAGIRTPVVTEVTQEPPAPPSDTGGSIALRVSGSDGFAATLDVDPKTLHPIAVRYVADVRLPVTGSQPPIAGPPPAQKKEVRLEFVDRRAVGGVYLPRSIVKKVGDTVLEQVALTSVEVNPALPADAFRRK